LTIIFARRKETGIIRQTICPTRTSPHSELDSQLQEFIDQAKALLSGEEYFEVSDIYDNLVLAFDEVLRGGKKDCSPPGGGRISFRGSKCQSPPESRTHACKIVELRKPYNLKY